MKNNRLTEIKEIKRTATGIGESPEREKGPEMNIKSTTVAQSIDLNEDTEIHTNHCEDNADV